MPRIGFKMLLNPGNADEYKRRHDQLWPELRQLLKDTGVSEYSIFLDESTNTLFGVMQVSNPTSLDALPAQPVMKRWWEFMSDIMATHADNSPVSIPLKEVFYLK